MMISYFQRCRIVEVNCMQLVEARSIYKVVVLLAGSDVKKVHSALEGRDCKLTIEAALNSLLTVNNALRTAPDG